MRKFFAAFNHALISAFALTGQDRREKDRQDRTYKDWTRYGQQWHVHNNVCVRVGIPTRTVNNSAILLSCKPTALQLCHRLWIWQHSWTWMRQSWQSGNPAIRQSWQCLPAKMGAHNELFSKVRLASFNYKRFLLLLLLLIHKTDIDFPPRNSLQVLATLSVSVF